MRNDSLAVILNLNFEQIFSSRYDWSSKPTTNKKRFETKNDFDDPLYRQENNHSKFNAFTLATCTIANSEQNFYTNSDRAANKF